MTLCIYNIPVNNIKLAYKVMPLAWLRSRSSAATIAALWDGNTGG